jgi:hypothetical protein
MAEAGERWRENEVTILVRGLRTTLRNGVPGSFSGRRRKKAHRARWTDFMVST